MIIYGLYMQQTFNRIVEAILLCKDIALIHLPGDPVAGQFESEEHSDGYML